MILCTVIWVSCQVNATNTATIVAENRVVITPIDSLTPTPSQTPVALATPKSKEKFDIHSKVGIVDVTDDQIICFRTKNPNLNENTPILIVTDISEPPQKILEATVAKKLKISCVSHDSDAGDSNAGENFYYTLTLTNKNTENSQVGIGIGIIQPSEKAQIQNNVASLDLNSDGKPEYFRLCASNEGLHLTIWTGKPLIGKRIWHYYYYLHYDTDPTCEKKDWEGRED